MPEKEISALTTRFVEALSPSKVYLFGSFASGTPRADSDYDFYIVMDDSQTDWHAQAVKAYKAIRHIRTRPVDILVGTCSQFEIRKAAPTIENEVYSKGVLLYDAANTAFRPLA